MLEQNPALVREITQAFAELQREQEAAKHTRGNDASTSSSSASKKTKVKASDYFLIGTYIAPYVIYSVFTPLRLLKPEIRSKTY